MCAQDAVLHLDDLVISVLIEVVVLAVGVDHPPALLLHLSDLVEHRQRLIARDQQFQVGHRDEGPGAAHPGTAVDHRDGVVLYVCDDLVEEETHSLALFGGAAIWPVGHVVVRYLFGRVLEGVREFYFFNFDIWEGRVGHIFKQLDREVFLDQGAVVCVDLREIPVALDLAPLNEVAKHEDRAYLVLLDHPPEVVDRDCERPLGGHHSFPSHRDHVRVYVVVDRVVVAETHAGGVEGHEGRVAVERELFWVFVEFVDVILGLGHEGQQFELCGCASGHAFEGEIDEFDGGAHLFEVLVLVNPLLGNVIEIHLINTDSSGYSINFTPSSPWTNHPPPNRPASAQKCNLCPKDGNNRPPLSSLET
jgi:hypothetical protein